MYNPCSDQRTISIRNVNRERVTKLCGICFNTTRIILGLKVFSMTYRFLSPEG